MSYLSPIDAVRESRQGFRPPPRHKVSEWADANRYLSPEASAEPGRWYTARAEYQRAMMDALNDPSTHTVVVMSSSQVGKTEILNNIVGYYIAQDPSPILVVQPTVEMGMAWSKDRLAPMLRDTPCLKGKVQDPRSRDSGNTTMHKIFPGGHITVTGSNSAAGLASRPIRVVLADEVDRWPSSAGSEGDPLKLAFKRTTTFWNRKRVVVSTPTVKGFSRIESAFMESDQRRYYVPCVHCLQPQLLKWANVRWPEDCPAAATYWCEFCGGEITDADKLAMVRRGEWRAEGVFSGTAGFHISELYSPWRSFGEIAVDFCEAKRNPELLRVWVNTSLGETWEETGDVVEASPLFHRRERMEFVPDGVKVLVAGVDVQQDRVEASLIGFGTKHESWVFDHVQVFGDPAKPLIWSDLDRVLLAPLEYADGRKIKVGVTCIDSGGHFANEVYNYCRMRASRRVFAIKGMPGEGRALVTRPSRSNQGKVQLFPVGVHTAKDSLYARLRIQDSGPGYVHFSSRLDEEYFSQLTGEKVVTRYVKGRPAREYVKTRPRNEALDCFVYALAAMAITNINLSADDVVNVATNNGGSRVSFVNRWR